MFGLVVLHRGDSFSGKQVWRVLNRSAVECACTNLIKVCLVTVTTSSGTHTKVPTPQFATRHGLLQIRASEHRNIIILYKWGPPHRFQKKLLLVSTHLEGSLHKGRGKHPGPRAKTDRVDVHSREGDFQFDPLSNILLGQGTHPVLGKLAPWRDLLMDFYPTHAVSRKPLAQCLKLIPVGIGETPL